MECHFQQGVAKRGLDTTKEIDIYLYLYIPIQDIIELQLYLLFYLMQLNNYLLLKREPDIFENDRNNNSHKNGQETWNKKNYPGVLSCEKLNVSWRQI